MTELAERPAQALDVMVRNIGGIVYIARGQNVRELNEVGAFIWSHCDATKSVDQIAETLSAEYDVDVATARADVEEFLEVIGAEGFVE